MSASIALNRSSSGGEARVTSGIWIDIDDNEARAIALDPGSTDPEETQQTAGRRRERHTERCIVSASELLAELDRGRSSPRFELARQREASEPRAWRHLGNQEAILVGRVGAALDHELPS